MDAAGWAKSLHLCRCMATSIFARLFGVTEQSGAGSRINELLMTSTGLSVSRSLGQETLRRMKQMYECCALIHDPELLILSEPTTGLWVTPNLGVSGFGGDSDRHRAEQYERARSTAYMEGARRNAFDWLA